MDSGNSGSLQSSSGGDEEYDSRAADSFSVFMKPHGGPISNSPPPPALFDPLSSYLQLNQNNPNSPLLNPNMAWPRPAVRSDPNHSIMNNNPMLSASNPYLPPPPAVGGDNINPNVLPPQTQHHPPPARNPKKRSRASRRAPTTVLTTDTTNFRAMVQEFTGIPAPPFNNSPFPRNRLELFGTRSTSLDAPPYLRRPFAAKVQSLPPFLTASSSLLNSTALDTISASSSTNNMASLSPTTTNSAPSPAVNYQQNLYNPLLNSLLQTNPKFPFAGSPPNITGAKPQNPSFGNIPQNDIKLGGLDEFGSGHGNPTSATLGDLPNLISSDHIAGRNEHNDQTNNMNNNGGSWRNNGVGPDEGDVHPQARMRPDPAVNGGNYSNHNQQRKMNDYLVSTSGFHGERGPENGIAGRGEGMVESWICSSE